MALWEPYRLSTQAHVPGPAGKIAHDPFHLVRYMNAAVNEVRKAAPRAWGERGQPVLAGTKQLWRYGYEHPPASRAADFERLKGMKRQTSRAWAIKELFREFWERETVREAGGFFGRWYDWAIRLPVGRQAGGWGR